MGGAGLLGRPHPAFGHPLPEGEGLSLGRVKPAFGHPLPEGEGLSLGRVEPAFGHPLPGGEGLSLGRPHPAFGHPLPKGEGLSWDGLSLGRNEATLSQRGRGSGAPTISTGGGPACAGGGPVSDSRRFRVLRGPVAERLSPPRDPLRRSDRSPRASARLWPGRSRPCPCRSRGGTRRHWRAR